MENINENEERTNYGEEQESVIVYGVVLSQAANWSYLVLNPTDNQNFDDCADR